jgi:aspartyl-tRNA(Asn)/glutamyl-tRNA(Gln) amidotransferase subunit C
MPLTLDEVEHIAALARLELAARQKQAYQEQLSAILDYIAKLQELDTSNVPPTAGGGSISRMSFRDDVPSPGLTPEELLANAPQKQAGQFKMPPVFEHD